MEDTEKEVAETVTRGKVERTREYERGGATEAVSREGVGEECGWE